MFTKQQIKLIVRHSSGSVLIHIRCALAKYLHLIGKLFNNEHELASCFRSSELSRYLAVLFTGLCFLSPFSANLAQALTFTQPLEFPAGYNTGYSVSGRFNGDRLLDLAVANPGTGNISVLIGNGSGQFSASQSVLVGTTTPDSMVAGDVNGDGHADLVIASSSTNSLVLLIGSGNGNFALPIHIHVPNSLNSVAIADLNRDGIQDLITAGAGGVGILLGTGGGTFAPISMTGWSTPPALKSIVTGDFNHDGLLDIAIGNSSYPVVTVQLGDGLGSFGIPITSSTPSSIIPKSIKVADFNGDGFADVAATGTAWGAPYPHGEVIVLFGNGAGRLPTSSRLLMCMGGSAVDLGDFNRDGKVDIAASCAGFGLAPNSNVVTWIVGNGLGGFTDSGSTVVNGQPQYVTVGDFASDGKPDLVVSTGMRNTVAVLLNTTEVALPVLTYSTEAGYGSAGVLPATGTASTTLTYKVVYTHPLNTVPIAIQVCIDAQPCSAMSVDLWAGLELHDGNYANGEQYVYTTTLAAGIHSYYFTASDGATTANLPASGSLSGPAVSDLSILTSTLPDGTVRLAYSQTLAATGGMAPYSWAIVSPPPGLNIKADGAIFGTPTAEGLYGFDVSVTDATGAVFTKAFSINVVLDTTPPVVTVPGNITVEAGGAAGSIVTFAASASDLVDGVLVPVCTPASGTTFAIGTTTVTCSVADAAGNSSSATFTVTVQDTTAPVIAVHAGVTAEAASAAGAAVSFSNPATTDTVDGAGVASCAPASGTTFALGNTTVTCNATDAHGNAATPATFVVHVVDTTAPVLTVPANMAVDATNPSGADVTYLATATDIVSSSPEVVCTPASGSAFPIGDTTVTCMATDAALNSTTASFIVTVRTPAEMLANLTKLVDQIAVTNDTQGIASSLDSKLQSALDTLAALKANSVPTACNKLSAFISHVEAQSGKAITVDQANELIAAAKQIMASLGCT